MFGLLLRLVGCDFGCMYLWKKKGGLGLVVVVPISVLGS